jgi:hypothetical protein
MVAHANNLILNIFISLSFSAVDAASGKFSQVERGAGTS